MNQGKLLMLLTLLPHEHSYIKVKFYVCMSVHESKKKGNKKGSESILYIFFVIKLLNMDLKTLSEGLYTNYEVMTPK